MKDFIITCSSTCDLTPYYLRQHNMYYVSFYYYINDERFYDDFYKEHTVDNFYSTIKNTTVKTSQPDPEQYCELWRKLIDQGYDILHIELSSGISGAVNSARIAKSIIDEENTNAKIYVVDSLTACGGYGLLLDKLYEYKKNHNEIDDVYKYAEDIKKKIKVVFLVENLDQLIKGGRISKVKGSIGKLLNIVPILHVESNGKLESVKNARGLNNAMDDIVNIIEDDIDINNKIFINNSNCYDSAKSMFIKLKNRYENSNLSEENIYNVGTVIGAHTGSGAIVVSYISK